MNTQFKQTLIKYYLYVFFKNASFFAAVLTPLFTDWAGLGLFHAYFLQSWFMFWSFVLEVPTGVIADYFGRKHSIAIGAFVVTVGALVYGSFPNFWIFLLGEFIFALGFALTSGADKALLYDALKSANQESQRSKIFSRAYAIKFAAMAISAPIGSVLASRVGINAPMYLSAIPFFAAALISWSIKEPSRNNHTSESKRWLLIAKKGGKFIWQNKLVKWMSIDSILVASAAYYVIWLYQPLLKTQGIGVQYFGWIHGGLVGVEVLVSLLLPFFEKICRSTHTYMRISAILTAIAFLVTALSPSLFTISLFLVIAGGIGLTRRELIATHLNVHIPEDERATILSFVAMAHQVPLIILNPIIGGFADRSLSGALFIVGLLPFLALLTPITRGMYLTKEERK